MSLARIIRKPLYLTWGEDAQSTFKSDDIIVHAVLPSVDKVVSDPHLAVWLVESGKGRGDMIAALHGLFSTGEASPTDVNIIISPMPGVGVARAMEYAQGIVTLLRPLIPE